MGARSPSREKLLARPPAFERAGMKCSNQGLQLERIHRAQFEDHGQLIERRAHFIDERGLG